MNLGKKAAEEGSCFIGYEMDFALGKDPDSQAAPLKDKISIDEVKFVYNNNEPVIKNISFDIEKGQMIALVGASGAGKSTLADLVLRLHDVNGGAILYDGINIKTTAYCGK